jgi:signal transduction histidine kinase
VFGSKTTPQTSPHEPEVRRQQHIYLTNLTPILTAFNVANATFVAVLFWGQIHHLVIGVWYCILVTAPILQFTRWWFHLRGRPAPDRISGKTLERARMWAVWLGLVWGSTAFLFYTPGSIAHQMFLAGLIEGMSACAVAIMGPLPQVSGRFLISVVIPLIVRFAWAGEALHITVALMAITFTIAIMIGSRQSYKQFRRLIAFSQELEKARAHLVNALESTNDAFAIFTSDGSLSIANKRFLKWFPGMTHAPVADTDTMVYRFVDGRWVQSSLKPIAGGGFVSVHTDVTELKEREDQLIAANQEAERARLQAEEANRAKTDFLANMSHELRTPLNAIMGFSEMMRGEMFGPLGNDRYKDYSSDIYESADHLLSIISDILDLSKIETQNYTIDPERVSVRDVIGWVRSMGAQKQEAGQARQIEVRIEPGIGDVEVDLRAIKQVLLNLLSNALKFTPLEGRVGIDAGVGEAGEVMITVWDTGIGIPKEKLDWVRQPFHQFEGVFHKKYQGTGLGLSISDALVALHGGHIDIESEVDVGTRVKVVLPPERSLPPPDVAAEKGPRRAAG